jgi:predicted dehydrogenase
VNTGEEKKYLVYESPSSPPVKAIKMELEEFAQAIEADTPIRVSFRDGYRALKAAHEIVEKIEERGREGFMGKVVGE